MILVYTVCPNREEARRIGRLLVERRLAACANLLPIESFYWWQGELVEDNEHVLLLKTRPECYSSLVATVKSMHSYQVPAIIRLPVAGADGAYLAWLQAETVSCLPD
ncbi:MAG: divalent-cation tolerance protein CutA [Chloroflexi bacterium]|nr:divalent-cation tolerance protein CutA [Chloroflexota bacterium]